MVKHLQEKYGNAFVIITNLHEQMEVCTARSTDLKEQCKLFDRLYSLPKQLESKGADLSSPGLMSKILAKFRDDIKERVLEKKVALLNDQTWSMRTQMETIDKVLKQEEEIERHMSGTFEHQSTPRKLGRNSPSTNHPKKRSPFCFYCNSQEHWSVSCTKLKHPKERIEYLKQTNRCLGCGSRNHSFAECKEIGCTHCGKRHHTSICLKNKGTTSSATQVEQNKNERVKKSTQNFTSSTTRPCSETDLDSKDPTILAVAENPKTLKTEDTYLLAGSVKTMNPQTKQLRRVQVLLDTGADRSFIDSKLTRTRTPTSKTRHFNNEAQHIWNDKSKRNHVHNHIHRHMG
ncbi:zinc knuckle [Ostertagia ostertagi]